ncbi:MAG: DUF4199 domain-containing protein [Ginsengibacter sp.]
MEQPVTTTTTKGLILGLILVVISIVIYFTGIDMNGPSKWIASAIFVVGIIWSVNNYGKQINYNSTFGNYFGHGFKVTAVVTVIMILYLIIFIVLFPEFKEQGLEQAKIAMQKNKNMTSEQMEQGLAMTRKFFSVFVIGGTLIGYLIFGSLASLIGAAITKKEPGQIRGDFNQPMS